MNHYVALQLAVARHTELRQDSARMRLATSPRRFDRKHPAAPAQSLWARVRRRP